MKKGYKSGFVTLIGRPNVGKSTLMNHLIGQKIAITSEKPQTTRNRIQTVYTDEHGQIIFLDTPGIHKAKNKLGEYMVNVAEHTLREVDVILWLVEPGTLHRFRRAAYLKGAADGKDTGHPCHQQDRYGEKRGHPKDFIETYKDAYHFKEVIPVSAIEEDEHRYPDPHDFPVSAGRSAVLR